MSRRVMKASALLDAPAADAYAVIADYRHGHPAILPPPFTSLDVVEGGTGAGTVIDVRMRMLGREQGFRAVVSEPEPGRVLVETNDNGYVTTFTVEPRDDGRRSHVTIESEMVGRVGLLRGLEWWIARRTMPPVFAKELENLGAEARARS